MKSEVRFCFLALVVCLYIVFLPIRSEAQAESDQILPAGTLLRCTLNEPGLSSKTVAVGDPVLCNLAQVSLFGRPAFPRGAYLGGHLEGDKRHGQGDLNIQFDRLGVPGDILPVPAKIISVRGYKVDREGKIIGHSDRDRKTTELMITLRLMDDITIPTPLNQTPLASSRPAGGALDGRQTVAAQRSASRTQTAVAPPAPVSNVVVFRNGLSYLATNVHVDGNRLIYTKPDGIVAASQLADVDWAKTFQFNAEGGTALTLAGAPPAK